MGYQTQQRSDSEAWRLAQRQHFVITRTQLIGLGFTPQAIHHRAVKGRLHPVTPGVYAVGHPHLTQHGRWMAAVLGCGPHATLSHRSAAALWSILSVPTGSVEVSIPAGTDRRRPGIIVHRRLNLSENDTTTRHAIPVTAPATTLIDLAASLNPTSLMAAVNEADKRDLIAPHELRAALETTPRRPGLAPLRALLDRHTIHLTDSELERRFLPIIRRAGLPPPETQQNVNGFDVDFHWPGLGLVVETDGLRYHRTPAQQARDRVRDQTHTAAGLTPLRFTHAQVVYDSRHVQETLAAVARRLSPAPTARTSAARRAARA